MDEKNSLKQVDNHHNFWIHRVDLNIVSFINSEKIIAATKKRSTAIANVHSGDRIFLLTKRNNILEFFGYTQVDEVYFGSGIGASGRTPKARSTLAGTSFASPSS